MPSRGSKRNLLAGMGPLTPPASDDEADTNNDQPKTKLSSIRENGSPEHNPASSSSNANGAPSSMLGPRGVQPLKGGGDSHDEMDANMNNIAGVNCGDDEKKDDTTPAAEIVMEIEGTLLGGSSQGDLNVTDDNNYNDETYLKAHEPPEHRTGMPRRSSLKHTSVPPPTNASPSRRKSGGNARRLSASSVASEAESECSITLDAIGPALAAFGGAPAQGQGQTSSTNSNKHRFDNSRGASGATASTSNRSNANNNSGGGSGGGNNSGGGGPPPSLRARPGLLVKQKTARNVQNAKTTSFVQTAGMRRAKERHMAQQQKKNNNTSDPSFGSFGKTIDGRPRSGSGSSSRMMYGRRTSGVSHASSTGRGESSSQFGESMHLSGLANPDDYLEIDLCDECLHCPSLTALRQSFHESLIQGDNACSKAEDDAGR